MNELRKKRGFDFLSFFYDFSSRLFFGNYLLKSQTYFLPQLKKCNSVLIFGGGTGKILAELLKQNIESEYTYVDISSTMINKTKKRVDGFSQTQNTNFIEGSYLNIPADKKFDLIITPYVLDCFSEEELIIVMNTLDSKLNKDGQWLFTDFNSPQNGLMKTAAGIITRTLYFFFNMICGLGVTRLPDFEKEFSRLNHSVLKEKYFLKNLLVSKIYARPE